MLRHLPSIEDRPRPFQDAVFLQLFDVAEPANFSRQEQASYQTSLKYYRDINNVVDTAKQEGIEIGIESGLEIGRAEGEKAAKIVIARTLLSKMNAVEISQITGLEVSEIEQLEDD